MIQYIIEQIEDKYDTYLSEDEVALIAETLDVIFEEYSESEKSKKRKKYILGALAAAGILGAAGYGAHKYKNDYRFRDTIKSNIPGTREFKRNSADRLKDFVDHLDDLPPSSIKNRSRDEIKKDAKYATKLLKKAIDDKFSAEIDNMPSTQLDDARQFIYGDRAYKN